MLMTTVSGVSLPLVARKTLRRIGSKGCVCVYIYIYTYPYCLPQGNPIFLTACCNRAKAKRPLLQAVTWVHTYAPRRIYIYIYIYICLSMYMNKQISIYIYIYIYNIYIYIYDLFFPSLGRVPNCSIPAVRPAAENRRANARKICRPTATALCSKQTHRCILSLSLYIYIYVCVYIYIYIYAQIC